MSKENIVFIGPKNDDLRENVNVITASEIGVKNNEDYVLNLCDEAIKELKNTSDSVNMISQPTSSLLKDHRSATYVFEMIRYGKILRLSQTVTASEGYSCVFVITCTVLSDTYNDYETVFSIGVDSFEVLNEPNSRFNNFCLTVIIFAAICGIAGGSYI